MFQEHQVVSTVLSNTEDETRLVPNIRYQFPSYTMPHPRKTETSTTPLQKLNNLHDPWLFKKVISAAEIG
jgi:hypothetical protein